MTKQKFTGQKKLRMRRGGDGAAWSGGKLQATLVSLGLCGAAWGNGAAWNLKDNPILKFGNHGVTQLKRFEIENKNEI